MLYSQDGPGNGEEGLFVDDIRPEERCIAFESFSKYPNHAGNPVKNITHQNPCLPYI